MASFYSPFFTSGLLSHPSSPSTSSFPRRGSLPSESMYGTITSQSSAFYFTVQQHDSSFLSLDLAEYAAHSMRSMSLRRNQISPQKFTEQQRSPSQLRLRTSRDSLRSLPSPKPAPSSSLPSTPPPSTTAPSPPPHSFKLKPKSIAVPKLSIKTAFEHPRTAPLPKMTHRVSRSTPTLSLHLPPPLLSLDHISLSLSLNEDDDELIQSDSSTSPTDHSTMTTTHHHHRISFPLPPQHRRSLSSTQRHTHAHRHPRTSLSTVSTGYRACMRMDALAALEGRRTGGCECGVCEEEEKVNNENACVKRNFMSMSDDDEDDIDFGDEQDEKGVILLSPSSPTLYYPLSLPEYDQRTPSLLGVPIASSPTLSTSSSSGSSEGEGMEILGMKSVWSEDEDEDEDGDGEEEENDGDAQGLFVSPITPIHDKDEREVSWIHLTSPDGSKSANWSRSRKRVNAMTTTNTPKLASFKSFIDCDFEHRHERSFIEF